MPKAGAGAPLDLQAERFKGGHPLQLGRGICSLSRVPTGIRILQILTNKEHGRVYGRCDFDGI